MGDGGWTTNDDNKQRKSYSADGCWMFEFFKSICFIILMLGQIDLYGWTGKIGDELIKVGALINKDV